MGSIMNIIYFPLAMILKLCYTIVNNYGIAIILFAVIAKVLLLPLAVKGEKSRRSMQKFQPKINALQAKYKNDTRNPKYNEELQKLYTEEGYNPMSGCLPTLIQLPIIMGLWNAIRKPLTYIFDLTNGTLERVFNAIKDLGGLEAVKDFAAVKDSQIGLLNAINDFRMELTELLPADFPQHIDMEFLGLNLGDTPVLGFHPSVLIPIVSALTSFLVGYLSQKINSKGNKGNSAAESAAKSANFMLYTMPIISLIMGFSFQIGIGIYWTASNILSLAQTLILPLFFKEPVEEVKVKEKKLNYNQIEKMEREKALEEKKDQNKNSSKKH